MFWCAISYSLKSLLWSIRAFSCPSTCIFSVLLIMMFSISPESRFLSDYPSFLSLSTTFTSPILFTFWNLDLLVKLSSSLDFENERPFGTLSNGDCCSIEPPTYDLFVWSTSMTDILLSVVMASPATLASKFGRHCAGWRNPKVADWPGCASRTRGPWILNNLAVSHHYLW